MTFGAIFWPGTVVARIVGKAISISGSTRVALNAVVELPEQVGVVARGVNGEAKVSGMIAAADTAESKWWSRMMILAVCLTAGYLSSGILRR